MMLPSDAPTASVSAHLKAQLDQVKTIDLVHKVYVSTDDQTLTVEIKINPSLGLRHRNILFFPVDGFLADQVYKAIARLKYVASRTNQPHSTTGAKSATPAPVRRLVL